MLPEDDRRGELPPGARLIGWLALSLLIELCLALAGMLMLAGT